MGTHRIEIQPAQEGERGAFKIRDLMSLPIAAQSTIASFVTGKPIPVPGGSVRELLQVRSAALGGEDAYVKLVIRYTPAPGETLTRLPPPGWRKVAS